MYARVGIELWGSRYIGEYNTQQAENVKSKRRVRTKLRVQQGNCMVWYNCCPFEFDI